MIDGVVHHDLPPSREERVANLVHLISEQAAAARAGALRGVEEDRLALGLQAFAHAAQALAFEVGSSVDDGGTLNLYETLRGVAAATTDFYERARTGVADALARREEMETPTICGEAWPCSCQVAGHARDLAAHLGNLR